MCGSTAIGKGELNAQLRDVRKSGTQRRRAVAVVLPLKAPLLIDCRIFACGELHDLGSIAEGLAKLASGLESGLLGKTQVSEACRPACPTFDSSTTARLRGRLQHPQGMAIDVMITANALLA